VPPNGGVARPDVARLSGADSCLGNLTEPYENVVATRPDLAGVDFAALGARSGFTRARAGDRWTATL
jgi:hypothetical protein